MAEASVKVALLARPGEARDQLRRALDDLGAELVAEGDPGELDPTVVAENEPRAVLVSLEPAIEDALERFDALLAMPGVEVIYDDAEVTRQLDGWDLARWARHLAAKLVGSDLLPPAPGGAERLGEPEIALEPGAPPTPAQEMDSARLEDYTLDTEQLAGDVPAQASLADPDMPGAPEPDEPVEQLDVDIQGIELALAGGDATEPDADAGVAGPSADEVPMALDEDVETLAFDTGSLDVDLSALPSDPAPDAAPPAADPGAEPLLADLDFDTEPVKFSSFSDEDSPEATDLDDDVAALAAQLEAFEAQDQREAPKDPDFALDLGGDAPADAGPAPPRRGEPADPAPGLAGGGFGNLELVPMDADGAAGGSGPVEAAPVVKFGEPARRDRLSLADEDAPPVQTLSKGVLLLLAGLGGPDAVRQLLAELSPTLPVPVLLYQHLDAGKHDRLVGQLAKASRLPVDLAVEGKLAFPGRVAVLPPGLGLFRIEDSFRFSPVDGLKGLVAALPAADAGVVVLSGADPTVVPALVALKDGGALLLAQDPDSSFDPVAIDAVLAAGGESAAPAELALRLHQRWT